MFVPRRLAIILALIAVFGGVALFAADKDVRISLPKRTKPTPVQKLNQEGVKELQKHEYKKAKATFYKAYLIDPNDPFTLNNLGYAREKEGELEQAYKFYSEAAAQHSDTPIVVSMRQSWRGKPISEVAASNADKVRNLLEHEQSTADRVARLNTRGV
ncbi:MAG TPA: hypothetical protein VMD98_12360, partial [Bryocella sp.]|nr:hypothetical protein [Bryocella sp.]